MTTDPDLLDIRNRINDGTLTANAEEFSPTLRQQIFRTIAMQQKLSDKNCLRFMKHPLFFGDGSGVVDTLPTESPLADRLHPTAYSGFLRFFLRPLESVPNLADTITTLGLIYANDMTQSVCPTPGSVAVAQRGQKSLRNHVVLRIIARCRHLKRLRLVVISGAKPLKRTAYLLQDLAAVGSSELQELELQNWTDRGQFQPTASQRRTFQRLKRLRLRNVHLDSGAWRNLQQCCRQTLESLTLDDFRSPGSLITIRMNQLRNLHVRRLYSQHCPIQPTVQCPKLESYRFNLNNVSGAKITENLSALASMISSLSRCSIAVGSRLSRDPALLRRLIETAANSCITELHLVIHSGFSTETLNRIAVGLPSLRALTCDGKFGEQSSIVVAYDQFLAAFFRDEIRSENLRELYVSGAMSEQTAELLFSNCVRLSTLRLGSEFRLSDRHVLLWTARGAGPSRVHYWGKLTDTGLKALMEASGSNLRELEGMEYEPENVEAVVETLVNCCPMLERISLEGVSARLRHNYARLGRKFAHSVVTE